MKVTFRLPSKAIQYGYAEVEFEGGGSVTAEEIGAKYAQFTYLFLTGEQAGAEAAISGHKDPVDQAVETITESIPATVMEEDVSDGPGVEPLAKPWEQKVDAAPKPWENQEAAPKAAPELDW